MIVSKTRPLELAAKVLTQEHLQLFRESPFNQYGWAILDRWAMSNREALHGLQAQGTVLLYDRVLQQQTLEQEILVNNTEALRSGLTEAEVLRMNHVQISLQ